MSVLSIPAHFDGTQILLDEDVALPKNSRLIVTVINDIDEDRTHFLRLASSNLARAYEDDDVEYTEADCIDP